MLPPDTEGADCWRLFCIPDESPLTRAGAAVYQTDRRRWMETWQWRYSRFRKTQLPGTACLSKSSMIFCRPEAFPVWSALSAALRHACSSSAVLQESAAAELTMDPLQRKHVIWTGTKPRRRLQESKLQIYVYFSLVLCTSRQQPITPTVVSFFVGSVLNVPSRKNTHIFGFRLMSELAYSWRNHKESARL